MSHVGVRGSSCMVPWRHAMGLSNPPPFPFGPHDRSGPRYRWRRPPIGGEATAPDPVEGPGRAGGEERSSWKTGAGKSWKIQYLMRSRIQVWLGIWTCRGRSMMDGWCSQLSGERSEVGRFQVGGLVWKWSRPLYNSTVWLVWDNFLVICSSNSTDEIEDWTEFGWKGSERKHLHCDLGKTIDYSILYNYSYNFVFIYIYIYIDVGV